MTWDIGRIPEPEILRCEIDESYIERFRQIVMESFQNQAGPNGKVNLVFNRLFLVAKKL